MIRVIHTNNTPDQMRMLAKIITFPRQHLTSMTNHSQVGSPGSLNQRNRMAQRKLSLSNRPQSNNLTKLLTVSPHMLLPRVSLASRQSVDMG